MNCSLQGSSVRGIFQARILEWAAISFSRGSSQSRGQTQVSHIAGRRFTTREATRIPPPKQISNQPFFSTLIGTFVVQTARRLQTHLECTQGIFVFKPCRLEDYSFFTISLLPPPGSFIALDKVKNPQPVLKKLLPNLAAVLQNLLTSIPPPLQPCCPFCSFWEAL